MENVQTQSFTLTIDQINNLINKYKSKIKVKIDKKVIEEILNLSNYQEFGARKLDKIIKNKLENIILDKIILGRKSVNIKSIEQIINELILTLGE